MATKELDLKAGDKVSGVARGIVSQLKKVKTAAAKAETAISALTEGTAAAGQQAVGTIEENVSGLQTIIDKLTEASQSMSKFAESCTSLTTSTAALDEMAAVLSKIQEGYKGVEKAKADAADKGNVVAEPKLEIRDPVSDQSVADSLSKSEKSGMTVPQLDEPFDAKPQVTPRSETESLADDIEAEANAAEETGSKIEEAAEKGATGFRKLIDTLAGTSDAMSDLAEKNESIASTKKVVDQVTDALGGLEDRYKAIEKAQSAAENAENIWDGSIAGLEVMQNGIGAVTDVISHFSSDTDQLRALETGLGDIATTVGKAQTIFDAMQSSATEGLKAMAQESDKTAVIIGGTASALDLIIKKSKELGQKRAEKKAQKTAGGDSEGVAGGELAEDELPEGEERETKFKITAEGLADFKDGLADVGGMISSIYPETGKAFEGLGVLTDGLVKLLSTGQDSSEIEGFTMMTEGLGLVGETVKQLFPDSEETVNGLMQMFNGLGEVLDSTMGETFSLQGAMLGVSSIMQGLGSVVGGSAGAWLDYGANILSAVAMAIPAIVQLIAANSAEAMSGATAQSQSVPYPFNIISLAVSLAAVGMAIASIPKFANGGIAYGPTVGMFGEYSGAQNNPEVVAPLNKLQALLQPADGSGGNVRFRIEGRTLAGILEKENKYNIRTR